MAKKSLIAKANRKPKFSSRAYTRCRRCGRPRGYLRKFNLCRICFRELAPIFDCPFPIGVLNRRSATGNRKMELTND